MFATPSEFATIALPVLGVALYLIFVARPLAVGLCVLPFGFRRNEIAFIGWVGLRGAVSILLAILPIIGGLPQGQALFNAAFLIVLISLLVQGWTIRPMARWLGVIVPPKTGPLEKVELELPGSAHHELIVYRIAPESPIALGTRIPRWARPSLVIRDGRSMRLHHAGRLQPGDDVYIFTIPTRIRLLDRLFARPVELGSRDLEFWGDLTVEPSASMAELARTYDFVIKPEQSALSVAEFLKEQLGGRIEVGDRLALGPIEVIVRAVDDQGAVSEIGLALAPLGQWEAAGSAMEWLRGLLVGRPRRAAGSTDQGREPPGRAVEAPARSIPPGHRGGRTAAVARDSPAGGAE